MKLHSVLSFKDYGTIPIKIIASSILEIDQVFVKPMWEYKRP